MVPPQLSKKVSKTKRLLTIFYELLGVILLILQLEAASFFNDEKTSFVTNQINEKVYRMFALLRVEGRKRKGIK